ncbi:MAG: hypothetical protein ABI707_06105 [Ferruginibacter sp.]
MKFRLLFSLFFLLIFFIATGQKEKIKTATGEFTFQQYADNIIKLTWQPNGYLTSENRTDAVIIKPLQRKSYEKIFEPPFEESVFFKNSRIDFNKGKIDFSSRESIVLENGFQKDEFNGFRFKLQPGEKDIEIK